jgi:hypothetical protein
MIIYLYLIYIFDMILLCNFNVFHYNFGIFLVQFQIFLMQLYMVFNYD